MSSDLPEAKADDDAPVPTQSASDDARPPLTPVRLNHVAVFAIGTGLWAVALTVLTVVNAAGLGQDGTWMWVCLTGIGLGVIATVYARLSWRAR